MTSELQLAIDRYKVAVATQHQAKAQMLDASTLERVARRELEEANAEVRGCRSTAHWGLAMNTAEDWSTEYDAAVWDLFEAEAALVQAHAQPVPEDELEAICQASELPGLESTKNGSAERLRAAIWNLARFKVQAFDPTLTDDEGNDSPYEPPSRLSAPKPNPEISARKLCELLIPWLEAQEGVWEGHLAGLAFQLRVRHEVMSDGSQLKMTKLRSKLESKSVISAGLRCDFDDEHDLLLLSLAPEIKRCSFPGCWRRATKHSQRCKPHPLHLDQE